VRVDAMQAVLGIASFLRFFKTLKSVATGSGRHL
jgi:hypothetical protein